jgi:membrane glycosyltransferase
VCKALIALSERPDVFLVMTFMNLPIVLRSFSGLFIVCAVLGFASVCSAQTSKLSAVNVRLVTDEAAAVLAILAKRKMNQPVTDEDWQRVFQSEGYTRLKKRETSMKRSFEDADFKTFVLSDKLAEQQQALEHTLERWKLADMSGAAR